MIFIGKFYYLTNQQEIEESDRRHGEFDLIIGSDVLYEHEHAEQLAGFIDDHAKLHCEVIIVDPGRRQQGRFRKRMAQRGYTYLEIQSNEKEALPQPFAGRIMRFRK